MTDPTPTRAELPDSRDATDVEETLIANIFTLQAENQALRVRAEAADSLVTELRNRYAAGQVALTAARRAETAAWNDAIEAAARDVEEWGNSFRDLDPVQPRVVADDIRALRRAAPTEDQK